MDLEVFLLWNACSFKTDDVDVLDHGPEALAALYSYFLDGAPCLRF